MLSMTGFATKTGDITLEGETVMLTCTIKTLNARFLEISCKLPTALQALEGELIRLLKPQLIRGQVTLTIHASNPNILRGTIQPSIATAQQYTTALKHIQDICALPGTLSINDLITLPGVLAAQETPLNDACKSNVLALVEATSALVRTTRQEEGLIIQRDLIQRCTVIEHALNTIKATSIVAIEQQKIKVQAAIKELLQTLDEHAKPMLEQQHRTLYEHLEKISIHEELNRFENHLRNLLAIIASTENELGKRIDFTVQELSREINTISAKCSDVLISTDAITIKLELEKIREQTQNIL